ncbi:hypothetical protein ACIHBQ_20545 [Streptomyces sp. NPDC052492]|uniref:hypothetical protein n=1 Tax=Streptomyces sp. NPDC052492 TaxID=3365691 RepID=UPI0037D7983F
MDQILDGKYDLSNPFDEIVEEMNEDMCRRGARDGCGAFNLGDDLRDALTDGLDGDEAEEIMERIDESWKRKNTKKGANQFGFDKPGEFQIALTLAIMGHGVMSRNDDQGPPHAGDAWVDDKRTDFKSLNSDKMTRVRDALRSSERQQKNAWENSRNTEPVTRPISTSGSARRNPLGTAGRSQRHCALMWSAPWAYPSR